MELADEAKVLVRADDQVELNLDLVGNASFGQRSIHCIGRAVRSSRDVHGRLWLVLHFGQFHIRPALTKTRLGEETKAEGIAFGDRVRGTAE